MVIVEAVSVSVVDGIGGGICVAIESEALEEAQCETDLWDVRQVFRIRFEDVYIRHGFVFFAMKETRVDICKQVSRGANEWIRARKLQ